MRPRTLASFVVLSAALLVFSTAILSGGGLVAAQETGTSNDSGADTDGDGLSDETENRTFSTDPETPDTDGDGLTDGEEVDQYLSNPTNADTDADGIADGEEVEAGTDPTDPTSQNMSTTQSAPEIPVGETSLVNGLTELVVSFMLGAVVGGAAVVFVRR